jgi:hypothetical protein
MWRKFFGIGISLIVCVLAASIASAVDLKADLVGYWPLDESGVDKAGKSKGTLEGGAKWTKEGHVNGAVELDGKTGHVAISGFTLTTTELTAVAWMKGWKQDNWAGIMCSRNDPMTFWVGFTDQDTLSYVWNNNAEATWGWRGGPKIPQDEWAMCAITIDKDKAVSYIYTDAKKLKSAENKIPHVEQTIADNLKIGRDECCGDNRHIKGIIDEVMIFKSALNEDEITKLADTGLAVVNLEGKLSTTWGHIKN